MAHRQRHNNIKKPRTENITIKAIAYGSNSFELFFCTPLLDKLLKLVGAKVMASFGIEVGNCVLFLPTNEGENVGTEVEKLVVLTNVPLLGALVGKAV